MKHWYTVYTKPRQEATAEENLQRQNFAVYFPRIQTTHYIKEQWQDCIEPLFPRYLFIQADHEIDSLAPVRSTRGVCHLVRFGNDLVPLPDEVIAYLKGMEDPAKGLVVPESLPFKKGDRVKVLDGPFAQLQGVYQSEQGEQRALILLECLGQFTTVCLPHHRLASLS